MKYRTPTTQKYPEIRRSRCDPDHAADGLPRRREVFVGCSGATSATQDGGVAENFLCGQRGRRVMRGEERKSGRRIGWSPGCGVRDGAPVRRSLPGRVHRTARLAARRAPFPARRRPEAILDDLFGLTAFAPSVGNCQPARFVRVDEDGAARGDPRQFRGRQPRGARRLSRRAGAALRHAQARGPA